MKRTILNKIIFCLFIAPSIMLIVFLSSCTPSLGKFDKESGGFDDYYNSIGDIVGKYEAPKSDDQTKFEFKDQTYDLENSITNDYIIEHLSWEEGKEKVEFRQYVYIVIPFTDDLNVEEVALFVCTNNEIANNADRILEISAFYFRDSASCPDDDKLFTKSYPNNPHSDPSKDSRIASASISVTSSFDSFVLNGFRQTVDIGESYVTDSRLNAKKNSFLYLRIENNSALNKDTMTPIDISFINLLIRAV